MSDLAASLPPMPDIPPPARRIGVLERAGALGEVFLCSGFPTQIFLVTLMTSLGMQLQTADGKWSPVFVSVLSLLDTALLFVLIGFFLSTHRERARDVFLGQRGVLREAAVGLMLIPVVFLIASLVLGLLYVLAPQLHNVPRNPFEDLIQNPRDAAAFAFVATIAGGIREEIQRGFIVHRFRGYLGGGPLGVLFYSALFGIGHVDQGWDAVIAVATLGAIWGTIYLIRGSIVAPMVSHAGFNLAQLAKFLAMRQ